MDEERTALAWLGKNWGLVPLVLGLGFFVTIEIASAASRSLGPTLGSVGSLLTAIVGLVQLGSTT